MSPDYSDVFATLKAILVKHAKKLNVTADNDKEYTLLTKSPSPFPQHKGKGLYFASVRAGKAYVSYHLMPLYAAPELVKTVKPELKKRMQGKSCFNFKTQPTPEQKLELARITKEGLLSYAERKWL